MKPVQSVAITLATWFGAGFSPKAPGTCGTALAIPFYLLIAGFPWWLYAVTVVGLTAVGTWAAKITGDRYGEVDCQKIVIDEVVGYLITMSLVAPSAWTVIGGFFLFRLFDITKPFPVGYVDRNVKNAFGVMLDDILAGVYACASLYLLNALMISRALNF
ncbi:MAG: phosphatidylglycerophosphatase A [Myxococcota bacterium]